MQFDRIPPPLRERRQWLCWKHELREGSEKPTKVPYSALGGTNASVTDPNTWASFAEAVAAYERGGYAGIGYVLTADDPFTFIDFDDTEGDAELFAWHKSVFDAMDSYSEWSPSGKGLHTIVKGRVPRGRRKAKLEVYSELRFMTMTGDVFKDADIVDCQPQLDELFELLGGSTDASDNGFDGAERESDATVINRMFGGANGTKARDLYEGRWEAHYGSQSEASFAALNIIAYWTDSRAQVERLFRASAIYRPSKYDHRPELLASEIAKAFDRKLPLPDVSAIVADIEAKRTADVPTGALPKVDLPAWKRGISAAALMAAHYPDIRYVVNGYIAEGLTLLAGAPKIGKSWMAMGIGIAVASGALAFETVPVVQGDVLYLALEDNPRRLKKRLKKMRVTDAPERLTLVTEWPDLDNGCIREIELWADAVAQPTLVIVDVLNKVRPRANGRDPQYEADYRTLTGLHAVASKYALAVLVLHHTRKLEAEDPFDLVSGTRGLTGAADTVLVLHRDPRGQHSTLYGRGRDIEEVEKAVTFDPETARWSIVGDIFAVAKTSERQAILDALTNAANPMTPTEVAAVVGKERSNVSHLLGKMLDEGKVVKSEGGLYAPYHAVHSIHSV